MSNCSKRPSLSWTHDLPVTIHAVAIETLGLSPETMLVFETVMANPDNLCVLTRTEAFSVPRKCQFVWCIYSHVLASPSRVWWAKVHIYNIYTYVN